MVKIEKPTKRIIKKPITIKKISNEPIKRNIKKPITIVKTIMTSIASSNPTDNADNTSRISIIDSEDSDEDSDDEEIKNKIDERFYGKSVDWDGVPLEIYRQWNVTNLDKFKLWAFNNLPNSKHCSKLWKFLKTCGWRLIRGKGHLKDRLKVPDIVCTNDELLNGHLGKWVFWNDVDIYDYLYEKLKRRAPNATIPEPFTGRKY